MIALAIVWSCLAMMNAISFSSAAASCINNYQELRASLVSYPQNIDNLLMAFYPPNQSPTHALDVHYSILGAEDVNATYQFRWVDSSVLLLLEVELFEALSFNMANLAVRNISIVLDPFCHEGMILDLLDLATIWVSFAMCIIIYYVHSTSDKTTVDGTKFNWPVMYIKSA